MAEGFRITESGLDTRVSESGDTRVTEGFFEGLVSLAGAATIAAVATASVFSSSDLQASGSKLFAGVGEFQGLTGLTSTSSVVSQAKREAIASSSVVSESSVQAEYVRERPGSSSLFSAGSFESDAAFFASGTSSFVASSQNTNTVQKVSFGFYTSFVEEAVRITEGENVRITESGDVRITDELLFNSGEASLVGISAKVLFNGVPYYKEDGVWKRFEPYVKHTDEWKEPVAVYYKTAGKWKRVY